MKFGTDGDGNYGYYGADGSLIPFRNFKTATKKQSYSVKAGYQATVTINFSDVFPNALLGVVSISDSGSGPVGAFRSRRSVVSINSSDKTVTTNAYGGEVGTTGNKDISAALTVTAVGY